MLVLAQTDDEGPLFLIKPTDQRKFGQFSRLEWYLVRLWSPVIRGHQAQAGFGPRIKIRIQSMNDEPRGTILNEHIENPTLKKSRDLTTSIRYRVVLSYKILWFLSIYVYLGSTASFLRNKHKTRHSCTLRNARLVIVELLKFLYYAVIPMIDRHRFTLVKQNKFKRQNI